MIDSRQSCPIPKSIPQTPTKIADISLATPITGGDGSSLLMNQTDSILYTPGTPILPLIEEFERIQLEVLWEHYTVQKDTALRLFCTSPKHNSIGINVRQVLTYAGLKHLTAPHTKVKFTALTSLPIDEQKTLAQKIKPATLVDLYPHLTLVEQRSCVTLTLRKCKTIEDILKELITHIPAPKIDANRRGYFYQFYIFLASKRVILLPLENTFSLTAYRGAHGAPYLTDQNTTAGLTSFFVEPLYSCFMEQCNNLFPYVTDSSKSSSTSGLYKGLARRALMGILFSTNMTRNSQISEAILDRLQVFSKTKLTRCQGKALYRVYTTYCALYTSFHPDYKRKVVNIDESINKYFSDTYPQLLDHPEYEHVKKFIKTSPEAGHKNVAYRLKLVCRFLLDKDPTASFFTVTREQCRGFTDWVINDMPERLPSGVNSIVNTASDFFIFLNKHTGKPDRNPIDFTVDKIQTEDKMPFTGREIIPLFVIQKLKDLLIADDYAFAKSLPTNYVATLDRETNTICKVWCPATTIALYTLLCMNLRTMGVRTLDSGELDAMTVDTDKLTYVQNTHKDAIPTRKEGFLKIISTFKKPLLALHVQSHKLHDAYDIPFIPEDLLVQLKFMLAWQKRYGGEPKLINIADDEQFHLNNTALQRAKQINIVPLFRDLSRPVGEQSYPVTDSRVYQLLRMLCRELEKREPALKITRKGANGIDVPLFDKHTLRVSLNTHLQYVGGLPIQDAQALLNHATPVMTLYYTKPTPEMLHESMRNAYSKIQDATKSSLDDYITNPDAYVHGKEAKAMVDKTKGRIGLWRMDISGICPGAHCSTGGISEDGVIHAVPEQRCALCRYRITGPQFLAGLTLEANNLMFRIKRNAKQVKALNEALSDAEAEKNPPKVAQLRNEITSLNNMSNLDWAEWQCLLKLIGECNEMLSNPKHAGTGLVPLNASTLHAELETTSEFDLMQSITKGMELFTISSKLQNPEAMLTKHELINDLLLRSGSNQGLLSLPKNRRLQAGNLIGDLLLEHIPESQIDSILAGERGLTDYPTLTKLLKGTNLLRNENITEN